MYINTCTCTFQFSEILHLQAIKHDIARCNILRRRSQLIIIINNVLLRLIYILLKDILSPLLLQIRPQYNNSLKTRSRVYSKERSYTDYWKGKGIKG